MTSSRHYLWLVLCSFFSIYAVHAQEGPHRPSKKWQQIDTDTVQVIFGKGLEKQAERVASLVHYLANSEHSRSIGSKFGKVSIILRNETTTPNGFVSISPFRSEFFTTAPQYNFSGTSDWLDLLTLHEYRHVQQNINAKVGITKLTSILFGQNGWGFMTGTAVPRWYSEGDAVVTETALSQSGRGRMPSFDMEYRALRQAGYSYSYEKASAFSFKNYVPSHYVMGYHMTAYARQQFGQEVWAKVLNDAGKFKSIFYPFSRSLKRHTGLTTPQLYKETFAHLDSLYQADAKAVTLTSSETLSATPRVYTEYHQPIFINPTELVVAKSGFENLRTVYLLKEDGTEERLFQTGIHSSLNFQMSFNNGMLVWPEMGFHTRWTMEDYSNIRTVSLLAGQLGDKKYKISHQSKYFAPAVRPDGQQIAVISQAPNLDINIAILSNTGELVRSLPNPDHYLFQQLRWMPDGKSLVSIVRKGQENALAQIDALSGTVTFLTPFSIELMAHPYPSPDGQWIFFDATYTGINNIFAVKLGNPQVYQVSVTALGAFEPSVSPDAKKLAFVEFSALGHQVKIMDINSADWKPIGASTNNVLALHKAIAEQEGGDILADFQSQNFETKKYSPLAHLFNLHSWNPVLSDPDQRELGLDLEIDDKMSTFSTTVGYRYNINEERGRVGAEVAYAGLFPVIRAGIVGKNERSIGRYSLEATDTIFAGIDTTFVNGQEQYDSLFRLNYGFFGRGSTWQESSVYAGITLPFNLTFHNMPTALNLSADWHFLQISEASDGRADTNVQALDLTLDFVSIKQQTPRQIFPSLGLGLYTRYRKTLGDDFYQGQNTMLLAYGYLPSFIKNHGFRWSFGSSTGNHLDNYQFRNLLGSSRGYDVPLHDKASRISLTYALPLFYPDIAVGSLAFIQRIKAKLFYDYASYQVNPIRSIDGRVTSNPINFSLQSVGVELLFDYRALRLLDVEMGLRYSYRTDHATLGYGSPHLVEFVFVSVTP